MLEIISKWVEDSGGYLWIVLGALGVALAWAARAFITTGANRLAERVFGNGSNNGDPGESPEAASPETTAAGSEQPRAAAAAASSGGPSATPTAVVEAPAPQPAPVARPAVSAGPSVIPRLSDPVRDFVGRREQIDRIAAGLRQSRGAAISALGTIGGQGGIGKTQLAYYVAREVRDHYPGGQVQINLRGLDRKPATPAEAMRDVVLALVPEQPIPENEQHLAGLYQGLLSERRVLVLADNAADNAQVAPLIPHPPSALLVTSRQSIPLSGVEAVDLDQLAPDEAVDLLRKNISEDRASDHQIARLAELCGYLPLALAAAGERLAGSRAISTPAYIEKLQRDRSDLRYRGREVMAVLAESVEALAHDQPELVENWRSLAVFPAPFDRHAAKAVGSLDDEELEALVSRNLLLFDEKEERFRLHDLFRDLAREGLSDENEYAAAKGHAAHFLAVESAAGARHIEDREGFFEGLRLFDRDRVHIEVGQVWAAEHAASNDEAAVLAQNYPLRAAEILGLRLHALDQIGWLETSARAAHKLGNQKEEGAALGNRGIAYLDLGEARKAIEYFEQHLAIARETGHRLGEGNALGNLGLAYRYLGEKLKAIEYFKQDLAIAREIGNRRGEGQSLGNLGVVYGDLGETGKAIDYYEQDLAIARETGDRRGEGAALAGLGTAYGYLGETRKAIGYCEQDLAIARETGDRRGEGGALHNRARVLDELERRDEAIPDAQAALAIYEEIEDPNAEKTRQMLADWGALPDE